MSITLTFFIFYIVMGAISFRYYLSYRARYYLLFTATTFFLAVRALLRHLNLHSEYEIIYESLFILSVTLLLIGSILMLKGRKILNKAYPVKIETGDMAKNETINLNKAHIEEQLKEKGIELKKGALLWLTDGKADGLAVVELRGGEWRAQNIQKSNRFVSPNWPFHISKSRSK